MNTMTSKERLLAAIERKVPDRLPVTTHHIMPYFLKKYMNGATNDEFFSCFGFDPIVWVGTNKPNDKKGEYYGRSQGEVGGSENSIICSENWRIETEELYDSQYKTTRYRIFTPKGMLTMVLQFNEYTIWVTEHLIKEKKDIESLKGAKYDILELGGGDASTTVISPKIFNEFVAPYDSELITAAHEAGQRIAYHTCGGMMPILEDIAAMKPDAMETFTPPGMGGDVNLKEAKKRIGDKVCMIGGFDQFHFLQGCSPEETRAEVRRCFEEAGENGGYILCPSDHFFDADIELIKAFVDEAMKCLYK